MKAKRAPAAAGSCSRLCLLLDTTDRHIEFANSPLAFGYDHDIYTNESACQLYIPQTVRV